VSRNGIELLRGHVCDQLLDCYHLNRPGDDDKELVFVGIVYSRAEGNLAIYREQNEDVILANTYHSLIFIISDFYNR